MHFLGREPGDGQGEINIQLKSPLEFLNKGFQSIHLLGIFFYSFGHGVWAQDLLSRHSDSHGVSFPLSSCVNEDLCCPPWIESTVEVPRGIWLGLGYISQSAPPDNYPLRVASKSQ